MPDGATGEWVMQTVRERTESRVDGKQMHSAAVWTSTTQMRSDSAKPSCPHSKDEIEGAIQELRDQNRLVYWHGLMAPADPDHIRAIIENEQEAGFTRRVLVGKCNELLAEVADA